MLYVPEVNKENPSRFYVGLTGSEDEWIDVETPIQKVAVDQLRQSTYIMTVHDLWVWDGRNIYKCELSQPKE